MKYVLIILFFGIFSTSSYMVFAEKPVEQNYIFPIPTLSPDIVIGLSEKYLANEKHIDLKKYFLRSLSFNFYNSNGENEEALIEAKWYISYQCKPVKNVIVAGCDFSLSISNTKSPEIVFYGGK